MSTPRTSWIHAIVRWLLVIVGCYIAAGLLHRTEWYRQHLCSRILSEPSPSREHAAQALARVGGEEELMELLKHPKQPVRDAARTALDARWFGAEGVRAARQLLAATEAINDERYDEALAKLDDLVRRHPRYVEALNRRASLHWQLGRPGASIRDCERALAIDPRHYGAWQGLGLCHLHLGNGEEARNCLRMFLQFQPHDPVAQEWLKQCDRLEKLEHTGEVRSATPRLAL